MLWRNKCAIKKQLANYEENLWNDKFLQILQRKFVIIKLIYIEEVMEMIRKIKELRNRTINIL